MKKEMTTLKFGQIISFLGSLLVLCLACDSTDPRSDKNPPPNFILLMGDDHGWDEVGYNGHPYVRTPVLDEMASNGLRLDRFHSGHPSCSPTRGSFLTGRHPNRYGTFAPNWSIRPEEITIAQLLKKAGYTTGHFGKWHLGPVKKESPTSPGAMGFDRWLSHDNFFELDPVLSKNGEKPSKIPGEGSRVIVDHAMEFIETARDKQQAFLAVVWFGSPHEPYQALAEDLDLYSHLPDSLAGKSVRLTSVETGQAVERPLREVLSERYAEITAMDRAIGNLRRYLEQSGLSENTMVWYCGDNGTPPSAARTALTVRGQKGTMYQGGILVPGVIEWPAGIPDPMTSDVISVTSDILPTLCEFTGLPLPDRPLDGVSLAPLIHGNMHQRPDPIFFWHFNAGQVFDQKSKPYIDLSLQEGTTPLVKMMNGKYTRSFRNFIYPGISEDHYGGWRVIMGNQYKLIINESMQDQIKVELYDLLTDQAEKVNVAASNPDVVKAMQSELRNWQESVLLSLSGTDYK